MTSTTHDLKHLVNQLKHHLEEAGYETTQAAGGSVDSATVNVWLRDGSYPIEAITLTSTTEFQDFSWGHGYEREMPLDTPVKNVADAVLATLPAQQKQPVLAG
ncbi:hypothetical protein [Streptomyces brevispora]|uniref:hypothetical protein n=1 Tax=Streptomyces brevispora TaxID=887462 RepID=UPI00380EAC39